MTRELLYDWSGGTSESAKRFACVALNDETLRDGLQSPSVVEPPADEQRRLLHIMVELGIDAATIGCPAAGPRHLTQVRALAREIAAARLPLAPICVARTLVADVEPIVRIASDVGMPIEVGAFIGASAIRRYAEGWTLDQMLRVSEETIRFAVGQGLPVMFVAEDTTRSEPDTVRALYTNAIRAGARRLCLTDTTGCATPDAVRRLVRFVRETVVAASGEAVLLDWHGHRDRGLALANALAAIEAGVDRVHGTALGVGERVGNTEIELLLVNLHLEGATRGDLRRLPDYCRAVARAMGIPIPPNHPVVGVDAFRTASGVHASAILKALALGNAQAADLMYSSVPAGDFGLAQRIVMSPMSGLSNVRYWLELHGYDANDERLSTALLARAKQADRVLSDNECHRVAAAAAHGFMPADVRY